MNSLPKTVTTQRHDYDLNPGSSAPESSKLTTRSPSHHIKLASSKLLSASKYPISIISYLFPVNSD